MNNRIPIGILVALVLIALIWRIANPPPPRPPGPLGTIPHWDSIIGVGHLGPASISPSGTMWAGAWNQTTKSNILRSAVTLIDLQKLDALNYPLKDGQSVASLGWIDDKQFWVMAVDKVDPTQPTKSQLITYVAGTETGSPKATALPMMTARILCWPPGSDKLLAQLAGVEKGVTLALLARSGELIGKQVMLDLPSKTRFARAAAISPDGNTFVFAVEEDAMGGNDTYYLADARSGTAKRAFGSADVPGRTEDLWVSPAGVLLACSERDKFRTMVFDPATGKVGGLPKVADITKAWPDAPKSIMCVSYNAGYDFDLASGKAKKLFDLTKQGQYSDYWRQRVQDGRLYPRKGGDYTSVAYAAGGVDIRLIKKNGDKGQDILPRR
jgi:hypothetical protein